MGGDITSGMENPGNDVAHVATAVRQAIEQGLFVADQRLVEADLAKQFSASRATIRAALLDLTSEGVVERNRYQGARVRAVSVDEAIEITEVRSVIEALCAAKAAEQTDSATARDLRAIIADMRAAVADGDLPGYSRLNQALHGRIIEASGHATAAMELERLRVQGIRHQFRLATIPGRALVSLEEHQAIVDAIVARDPEAATNAVSAHLASVIQALRASGLSSPATPSGPSDRQIRPDRGV
jgi:DNA-binding GntR family transcriptional regulator